MNLTRPEKKYCWDFGYRKIKCPCEEEVCSHLERNKIIDDISAYQNQQMERLEEFLDKVSKKGNEMLTICEREKFVFDNLKNRWQKLAFTFYSEIVALSSEATKIRELLSQKGGENKKR